MKRTGSNDSEPGGLGSAQSHQVNFARFAHFFRCLRVWRFGFSFYKRVYYRVFHCSPCGSDRRALHKTNPRRRQNLGFCVRYGRGHGGCLVRVHCGFGSHLRFQCSPRAAILASPDRWGFSLRSWREDVLVPTGGDDLEKDRKGVGWRLCFYSFSHFDQSGDHLSLCRHLRRAGPWKRRGRLCGRDPSGHRGFSGLRRLVAVFKRRRRLVQGVAQRAQIEMGEQALRRYHRRIRIPCIPQSSSAHSQMKLPAYGLLQVLRVRRSVPELEQELPKPAPTWCRTVFPISQTG